MAAVGTVLTVDRYVKLDDLVVVADVLMALYPDVHLNSWMCSLDDLPQPKPLKVGHSETN